MLITIRIDKSCILSFSIREAISQSTYYEKGEYCKEVRELTDDSCTVQNS